MTMMQRNGEGITETRFSEVAHVHGNGCGKPNCCSALEQILSEPDVAVNTAPEPARGVAVGYVHGFTPEGRPLLQLPGDAASPLPAITASADKLNIGQAVAVMFVDGDPSRPIIIGPMLHDVDARQSPAPQSLQVQADGQNLQLTAHNQIVLRCGKSSITLTRAGKIIIRGAYLLSRSSGVNRIKGGSVQIN